MTGDFEDTCQMICIANKMGLQKKKLLGFTNRNKPVLKLRQTAHYMWSICCEWGTNCVGKASSQPAAATQAQWQRSFKRNLNWPILLVKKAINEAGMEQGYYRLELNFFLIEIPVYFASCSNAFSRMLWLESITMSWGERLSRASP
jgi:hypothetical protein